MRETRHECMLVSNAAQADHSSDQVTFYHYDKDLFQETRKIIKKIDEDLFQFDTREQAIFYVEKIAIVIANYTSSIKEYFCVKDDLYQYKFNDLKGDLLRLCFRYLEEIQSHIERTYTIYNEQAKPMAKRTQMMAIQGFAQTDQELSELLKSNKVNDKLQYIILHPIRQIKNSNNQREVSQQQVNYLKYFGRELEKFLGSFEKVQEDQIIQQLYVLNFNNIALLSYICDNYQRLKEKIEDHRSLLDFLYSRLNELSRLPQNTHVAYNTDLISLKNQVQTWIEEEIEYLKQTIESKEKERLKQGNGIKLKLNYSVDVISGFFRLLHDTGISDSGANNTVKWITQNISSKNQPHISQQSIQRKFFDKHTNKEPLKDIVIHLLNHLNHNKD